MKRVPLQVVDSGNLVALAPAVLTVKAAALYCACSASLLNAFRSTDARRIERGEPMQGPAWVRLSYGIRYRVADLDEWLQRTAVAGGVMESRRRGERASEEVVS